MDLIHLLPDSVANQIAAGEVIQRPASCLKELVENSLDAGADFIQVIVCDAGRTLLQVIDNGKGMSPTDARMAFERHATSKIKEAADLFALRTMGFRGEALASVAAVAQVELLTRLQGDEVGTLLHIAGSEVLRQEPVQCPEGTNIKVNNLFFNVPARRRFLKTDTTELRNLTTCFQRIVLVYPAVRFLLVHNDEILFDLPASSAKQRIEAVFGKSMRNGIASRLVDLSVDTDTVSIHGFIGKPEDAQRLAHQYFFVNGRFMKHPYFHKAVMKAYEGMLAPDCNPSYFIYFDLSPDAIDVNIHPTKTEVKFADEQIIWQILLAAVRESLGKFNLTPAIDFNREGDLDIPGIPSDTSHIPVPHDGVSGTYNPFRQSASRTAVPASWSRLYEPASPSADNTPLPPFPDADEPDTIAVPFADAFPALFHDQPLDSLPVYLHKGKYILLSTAQGLLLIDRHRAHLTLLYHAFRKQLADRKGTRQQVLFPEILDLAGDDTALMLQLLPSLTHVGFDLTRLAPNSFSVDAVPAELGSANPLRTLLSILHACAESGTGPESDWEHTIALSLAEDAAIGQGHTFSEQETRDLLNRLFALDNFRYTPSGKTVVVLLGDNDIDKLFR